MSERATSAKNVTVVEGLYSAFRKGQVVFGPGRPSIPPLQVGHAFWNRVRQGFGFSGAMRYRPMRQIVRVASVVASALFIGACATTMSVSSHVARGVDVARYRTCDWGPADDLPTGDPRLDRNPFFQDHLQGAVERQCGRDRGADARRLRVPERAVILRT